MKKVALIGVGLLGGSLGLAVRNRRLAQEVAGYVRRVESVEECARAGAADYATTDLFAAVWNADLIVLSTPLAQMPALVKQMLPALKRGAIVTDVGSVKVSVVRGLESLVHRAGGYFVGSHPMAGSEKNGVVAARADLFAGAVCVLTPTRRTNPVTLRRVERFWKAVGAQVLRMSPELHDRLVSRTSHLPHFIAATLAAAVLKPGQPAEQARLCATGFRDTTRIASGSPEMWRDIALANRPQLLHALDDFERALRQARAVLAKGDVEAVQQLFARAKQRRDAWNTGWVSSSLE